VIKIIKNITLKISVILLLVSCPADPLDVYYYGDSLTTYNNIHVFLIGIDGWGSYSIPKADVPVIKQMMDGGSYTLNTRNVLPTGSMPNWASMLYGTTPAFHGFTHNTTKPTFPPVIVDEYGYFPNIFALVKKKIPACQVAILSEYEDIIKIIPSHIPDKAEGISGVETVTDYINTIDPDRPSFTFIHFDGVDGAGHSSGHNSSEYYRALHQVDNYLGKIKQAVTDTGISDNTIFILSADHGGIFFIINYDYSGIFFQHGGSTPEERQIPLVFWGPKIKAGFGIVRDTNIYDIAPTIAEFFGIASPSVWIGYPISEVLE
jgi:predicted AlkP superfamily pyrophosphatase or phosphodiesterase